MSNTLTYDDLGQILSNLQSKLADYRKKEANALAIFNEFKQVAERLQSGIYRYDVKTHRFHFFNRSIIELLGSKGADASEITSKSVLLRLHPDDRERVRREAKEALERGIGEVEYRFKKSDGTYRWLYDRWVVLRDLGNQPRYIEGIVMDTTRRKVAEEKLKESERNLRSLSSHLLDAQEKKWRRIALELHDELGQNLTVLKLQLRSIQKTLPPDQSHLQGKCEGANRYVDQIIENVRRISQELCPTCIEDLGLDESIAMLVEDFALHSKLIVSIETQKIDSLFTLQQRTMIYRIFQEALNNIQKHALARKVWIKIERKKKAVDIQIADDGKGFVRDRNAEENVVKAGLGLTAMEERARMLGGTIEVFSIVGIGCRLAFNIPITAGERNDEFLSYSFG
ncbi:sensor histidine kinase [Desulfosarcina cetonica]